MPRSRNRTTLAAMYAGAALTAFAAVFPFVDRATTGVLAAHIRAGYPAYGAGAVVTAVSAYLAILATVGALGLLGWLATIVAVRAGKSWAPWLGAGLLASALLLALTALTLRDTSGDVGLAPLLAWLLVLPCVPGLAAVALSRGRAS